MILELGCGVHPTERADVHHDRIKHADYVDEAWDLETFPWPWRNIDEIIALDVFEHLRPKRVLDEHGDDWRVDLAMDVPWWYWLNECHDALVPGGILTMRLPAWDNPLSYRDPTHYRVFHPETFHYWDPCQPIWHDYGRIYELVAEGKYWHVKAVIRDNTDLRYVLEKVGPDHGSPVPES